MALVTDSPRMSSKEKQAPNLYFHHCFCFLSKEKLPRSEGGGGKHNGRKTARKIPQKHNFIVIVRKSKMGTVG